MESATQTPTFQPLFAPREKDDKSSHRHRLLIGILGLLLPLLLWVIAGLRLTDGLAPWKVLGSISAYYYTGAVSVLVGILVSLAVFFFTYQGYGNKYRRRDRIAAFIAGIAAIGVAFFPTAAPGNLCEPSWWTPHTRTIHYISTVVLFGSFIFFSLVLFPKTKHGKDKPLPRDKQVRNSLYYFCGFGMLVSVLWAASSLFTHAPIFFPEALALELFAISWLVKGRADWVAVNFSKRAVFYSMNPAQFITLIQGAIKG